MALYSVELRRYIDSFSQFNPSPLSIREKIEIGRPKLFDFWYPFFDESKRKDFETNIIRRFYMVEVGFETKELFKFHLENWLLVNMGYWNKMFESELLKFEPFLNTIMDRKNDHTDNKNGTFRVDSHDDGKFNTDNNSNSDTTSEIIGTMNSDGTSKGTNDKTVEDIGSKKGNNTNTINENGFNRKVHADTPDNRLDITTEEGKGIIPYASDIEENTNNNHSDGKIGIDESTKKNALENSINSSTTHDEAHSKSNGLDATVASANTKGTSQNDGYQDGKNNEDRKGNENEHYVGKIGSETYQEMLAKYRNTFLRIENMIHEEMRRDLFMLVY
jgi:hypothetical protein